MDRDAVIQECAVAVASLEQKNKGMFGARYNEAIRDAVDAILRLKETS